MTDINGDPICEDEEQMQLLRETYLVQPYYYEHWTFLSDLAIIAFIFVFSVWFVFFSTFNNKRFSTKQCRDGITCAQLEIKLRQIQKRYRLQIRLAIAGIICCCISVPLFFRIHNDPPVGVDKDVLQAVYEGITEDMQQKGYIEGDSNEPVVPPDNLFYGAKTDEEIQAEIDAAKTAAAAEIGSKYTNKALCIAAVIVLPLIIYLVVIFWKYCTGCKNDYLLANAVCVEKEHQRTRYRSHQLIHYRNYYSISARINDETVIPNIFVSGDLYKQIDNKVLLIVAAPLETPSSPSEEQNIDIDSADVFLESEIQNYVQLNKEYGIVLNSSLLI